MSRKCLILCVCVVAGYSSTSHAFALQRLAAAIDVSHVASSGAAIASTALAANVPARLMLPPSIDLQGPITELRIGIPNECDVTVEVADDAGAPLFLAEIHMPAGWQKVGFSGRDALGNLLPNGVYYYTLTADGTSRTARVTVTR